MGDLFNDERADPNQKHQLRTFRTFKTQIKFENYLSKVKILKHRVALTKLRISNHTLEIEKGRYGPKRKKADQRFCSSCQEQVEDEKHFLLKCPLYATVRQELFNSTEFRNIDRNKLSEDQLFMMLINPPSSTQCLVSKYIYNCFTIRKNI